MVCGMKPNLKNTLDKSVRFFGIPVLSLLSVPLIAAYIQRYPAETVNPIPTSPITQPSQLPPPPTASSLEPPQPKLAPSSPPAKLAEKSPTPTPLKAQKTIETTKKTLSPAKAEAKPLKAPTEVSYQAPTPHNLEIRVAILQDAPSTTIAASPHASISDRSGTSLQTLSSNQGVAVTANGNGLGIGNWQLPPVVWVQPSEGGLTYVGDRWYRGKILLISQGNSLLVVNYVNLEDYLYSVVGSEMHADAPLEALKAQAIAARSYALVHIIRPASPWYDLGNTQRWQVYKGLSSEYNTGQYVVQETMGQILSYQGGIVESLYAATDEIVARAHSGRGMSQTGAYDLARQGYDHQRILSHYYPGVTLARIIINQ